MNTTTDDTTTEATDEPKPRKRVSLPGRVLSGDKVPTTTRPSGRRKVAIAKTIWLNPWEADRLLAATRGERGDERTA